MSTDHEREALHRRAQKAEGKLSRIASVLPWLHRQAYGPNANICGVRAFLSEVEKIVGDDPAAGWMPRPEPGSPEWQAMVERGARAIWEQPGSGCSWDRLAQHVRGQCINDATACLRAALNPGAPDAD